MTRPIPDFLVLSPTLAAKLAAVVVHADELFSPDGHDYDRTALLGAARDPEVQDWLQRCGPLAPVKRSARPSTTRSPGWIACAGRMPPEVEKVLAWNGKSVGIGQWMQRPDGKLWIWNGTSVHEQLANSIPRLSCEFTHWMPLPAAPVGEYVDAESKK